MIYTMMFLMLIGGQLQWVEVPQKGHKVFYTKSDCERSAYKMLDRYRSDLVLNIQCVKSDPAGPLSRSKR